MPDDLIMRKIVENEKKNQENDEKEFLPGRVFIFPTLQFNVVGFREDETTFTELLKFLKNSENGLEKLKLATGYLNLQKSYADLIN